MKGCAQSPCSNVLGYWSDAFQYSNTHVPTLQFASASPLRSLGSLQTEFQTLKAHGYWVRGVDVKYPECNTTDADELLLLDLRRWENCPQVTKGMEEVCALAADIGGLGFISLHPSQILHSNSLINIHTLDAARANGIKRYLYGSSACIYPEYKQTEVNVTPLREEDAYPAQPQDAYGWERLIAERLCMHYERTMELRRESCGFTISFARWEPGTEDWEPEVLL